MARKNTLFEGYFRFKFNNLGLALGMALKSYIRVAKGLKLKVGKFLGLVCTFVEATGKKLLGCEGLFWFPILNWVELRYKTNFFIIMIYF